MSEYFDLYDYRRRVAAMYYKRREALERGQAPAEVWQNFCQERQTLFAQHPQSALDEEQKQHFQRLRYFPYDPMFCVPATVEKDIPPRVLTVAMNAEETMTMTAVALLHFTIDNQSCVLTLYWLNLYGGGLFLPFRDATCPAQSYGGGRYLFDTIKGSDFLPVPGIDEQEGLLLDFNYAYNPSCAYNARWVCPLAPLENRLSVAIPAGEQNYSAHK